ncbi:helix-turn-helix domain-containing protein [Alicyclobacillus mengziensis]
MQFITVQEYSELVSLDLSTVYRLVNRGEIPVKRIGRSIRIPVSALEIRS